VDYCDKFQQSQGRNITEITAKFIIKGVGDKQQSFTIVNESHLSATPLMTPLMMTNHQSVVIQVT